MEMDADSLYLVLPEKDLYTKRERAKVEIAMQ